MLIREEIFSDYLHITQISDEAFHGSYESALVNRLRQENLIVTSLVATDEDNKALVGHILFSALDVRVDGRQVKCCSLAPVAVRVSSQRKGVGSALIRRGLEIIKAKGYSAVIVVGHPEYYSKFGFSHHIVAHLSCPFQGKEAFMGLEFIPLAVAGQLGAVKYPAAFGIDDSPNTD